MKNLEWNVVKYDTNKRRFVEYNVLLPVVVEDIKARTAEAVGRAAFAEGVGRVCRYYFGSRTECEIILEEWPIRDNPTRCKVDVYDQLVLNWDRFIDYLCANLRDGESDG